MYISYRKHGVRIGQVWFEEKWEKTPPSPDIVFFHGMKERQEGKDCRTDIFHTLSQDLLLPEEELYSGIQKNVRYEIRKNEKEPMEIRVLEAQELVRCPESLKELEAMYEAMYRSKGMKQRLNHEQLLCYAKTDALVLTEILSQEQILVIHSYLTDGKQTRLLHSVSEFRDGTCDANLVARANKRLHWEDIKLFKERGVSLYDWGGISDPDHPNGIDAFKMKFGGKPLTYYNVLKGVTVLGKLGIRAMNLKNRNAQSDA